MNSTMVTRARVLVSEAEFLALPVSATKTELIDGEVIVATPPSPRHQILLRRLVTTLESWAKGMTPMPFVGLSPFDLKLGNDRIVQPDVFVVVGPVDEAAPQPWTVVPDLCVEVLSTDRVYDRITKRLVYAQAGVREYWTVEPYGVVEQWTGDGLSSMAEIRDRLTSSLLPGLELDVPALFA